MLISEVAALIGRGGADDRDVRNNGAEIEPFLAVELLHRDDRLAGRRIHGAALVTGVGKCVETDFGQHAGSLGGRLAMHVEQDAGRHVIGGDRIVADHLPDPRRLGGGGAGRIGAAQGALQQARLRQMIDALDAIHVAGGYRVQRGDVARMTFGVEALADRGKHGVWAAEAARRRHRDDHAVLDQAGGIGRRDELAQARLSSCGSIITTLPVFEDCNAASADASDQMPSSPVAQGWPSPRIAAWNWRSERV